MLKPAQIMTSLAFLFAACAPVAQAAGNMPSCYAKNKIENPQPQAQREVFVLIDQTTPLDVHLRQSVLQNVGRILQPGTAFSIASFSSFGQGRYLEMLAQGYFEVPLSENLRNNIGVKTLKKFDKCLSDHFKSNRNQAGHAVKAALDGISAEYAKSDVLGSLRDIGGKIRLSKAEDKVLFLASDMLENSGITTFYANRSIRKIDPALELRKIEEAGLLADLGGARVFILGAGLVQDPQGIGKGKPATDSGVYRDPKTMKALRDFWTGYFERSNAKLEQFGAPALLVPIE